MPKIPDYTQLKRDIPQVSGAIDVRGVGTTVAPALMKIAGVTAGIHERKNKNLLAKAESNMFTDLIAESNAYDQDPDYGTIEERSTGNMEAKLGEHAATITDPALRQQFIQTFRPKIAQAQVKLQGVAFGKERDFERGELTTSLETLRNAAVLSGGDDILGANDRAGALIQSHVDLGHVDADEAVKFKASFRDDVSKGYLETLEPEERVAALKQPWAKKNLAPDDYIGLRRKADEELRIGKAQTQVDEYLDSDMDRAEVMTAIDKKYSKKPELRKEVETRFDYAFSKQEKARVEEQSGLFDQYYLPVRSGESMVADMPREDLERMSPSQQNSLYSAQSSSVSKAKVPFNINAEDNLNILYQGKRFQDLREYFIENASSMSDTQNNKWSKATVEGVSPELKSPFTVTQTINNKIPNYSDSRKADLNEALTEWMFEYQTKEGYYPPDDVRDKQLDRMIMEHDTSWWWGVGTKPVFEMSDEEKTKVLKYAREDDPDSFKDAEEYFKIKGTQPDHGQFMEAYTTLKDNRRAK